jgi:NAD(P)-dependent dehydrogenase (short-subunit alcohol dehydrogenase family)
MSAQKLTVLITGSNQGLGYETARQLSKHSHIHLFISGRNPERLQEALEKISNEDGCKAVVHTVVMDVSDDDSIKAAVKEVEAKVGSDGLDVLVVSSLAHSLVKIKGLINPQNNSGITKEQEVPTRGLRTVFQEVFAVNVFGAAVTADAFLPLLKRSKSGPRIVNISSGLGSIGTMILPDGIYRNVQLTVSHYPNS